MSNKKRFDSLIPQIEGALKKGRSLGAHADLSGLASLMEEADNLAVELGLVKPYGSMLIAQFRDMQERADYYKKTGLDAPSITNGPIQ